MRLPILIIYLTLNQLTGHTNKDLVGLGGDTMSNASFSLAQLYILLYSAVAISSSMSRLSR